MGKRGFKIHRKRKQHSIPREAYTHGQYRKDRAGEMAGFGFGGFFGICAVIAAAVFLAKMLG